MLTALVLKVQRPITHNASGLVGQLAELSKLGPRQLIHVIALVAVVCPIAGVGSLSGLEAARADWYEKAVAEDSGGNGKGV